MSKKMEKIFFVVLAQPQLTDYVATVDLYWAFAGISATTLINSIHHHTF